MKRYYLTVRVAEPNDAYKPWNANPMHYNGYEDPRKPEEREIETNSRVLEVVLTDDEYDAVKRAVLAVVK